MKTEISAVLMLRFHPDLISPSININIKYSFMAVENAGKVVS